MNSASEGPAPPRRPQPLPAAAAPAAGVVALVLHVDAERLELDQQLALVEIGKLDRVHQPRPSNSAS